MCIVAGAYECCEAVHKLLIVVNSKCFGPEGVWISGTILFEYYMYGKTMKIILGGGGR